MKKRRFYAVKEGHVPGIYENWNEAKSQVYGYSSARYKAFFSKEEVEEYLLVNDQKTIREDQSPDVLLYTDGSFSKKNNQYGWGYVVVEDDVVLYSRFGIGDNPNYLRHRHISGEVVAILQGLDYVIEKGYEEVQVCYDYEGIEKWIVGDWRTNTAMTNAYCHYFKMKADHIAISFKKILAHSGDKFNGKANRLAKTGANICRKKAIK